MPIGEPLVNFLQACPDVQVTLTFEQVEQILGHRLPASGRKYTGWWHKPSWHTQRWKELGWTMSLSLAAETVTFTRQQGDSSPPA
jgi:hypothetical protein